jgi:prepilin-type N-terminal cleavage/methylation domain-containing protein
MTGRTSSESGGQAGITLIELLVSISILAVVTTLVLGSWFALQSSFAHTSRSSQSREFARDAVTRMTQEIRDAQAVGTDSAIVTAERFKIVFYSTYNQADNSNALSAPRQTAFVYVASGEDKSGTIYRVVDANHTGVDDEIAGLPASGRAVVGNVVNWSEPDSTLKTSVFRYSYYDPNSAVFQAADNVSTSSAGIREVHIRVLVDLNPGKSPVYMDLKTTAQPRNMRPST